MKRINHQASFKDPAARVFTVEGDNDHIFRELHPDYLSHYHHFNRGLKEELIKKKWLIPFEEINENGSVILKARKVPFVSFPYEWTFNQWKDAALLTLKIQFHALKHGMILKDATPFNIVFDKGRPVFIDISSFEIFIEGKPWQAFKQFSENFYLPLLLVKYFDTVGNDIYQNNINGIPLSKGLSLLPAKAYLNFNTLFFLAMPDKIRGHVKDKSVASAAFFTKKKNEDFSEQLFTNINKLKQTDQKTKWNDYYDKHTGEAYMQEKEQAVKNWLGNGNKNKTLIDFGANTGHFSKQLANGFNNIIAFDGDIRSIDELYIHCRENKIENISCFTANLSQPTPAVGWNNGERPALLNRLKGDTGLALALVHHLAISDNIRFAMMASLFASFCNELIIEFVPKEDDKVQLLLKDRQDIFDWYNYNEFVSAFGSVYTLQKEQTFSNNRILLHFTLKKDHH